jgi:phosphonate transport system substrate-binding protein
MTCSIARRWALKGALACAFAASLSILPAIAEEAVLRVSAIPDEAPTELQRKFAPLGKYLEAQTGMKVSSHRFPTTPPSSNRWPPRKIDLAWLGGFTFIQAKIRTNGTAIPIAQREEDAKFTSKFITADPASRPLPTSRARPLPSVRRPRPRAA